MTAPGQSEHRTPMAEQYRERLARRIQGRPPSLLYDSVPEPPPGIQPLKRCSRETCWSHLETGNPEIPWIEFYEDKRVRSGLTSQCKTCQFYSTMAPARRARYDEELRAFSYASDGMAEPPTPAAPPDPIQTALSAPVTANVSPEPPPAPVPVAPTPARHVPIPMQMAAPYLFVTDKDGDRWGMALGFGPVFAFGRVDAEEAVIHLPFAPGDAPQSLTLNGAEARRIELIVRTQAAMHEEIDPGTLAEAIMLWEQEQVAHQATRRVFESRIQTLAQDAERLGLLIDQGQADLAAKELERVELARRLGVVEQDRIRLERELRLHAGTDVGEALGQVADAQEETRKALKRVEVLEEQKTEAQAKISELRRQKNKISADLEHYQALERAAALRRADQAKVAEAAGIAVEVGAPATFRVRGRPKKPVADDFTAPV